jgi:hypothetical protein
MEFNRASLQAVKRGVFKEVLDEESNHVDYSPSGGSSHCAGISVETYRFAKASHYRQWRLDS